jgi:hypothetical protein
LRRFVADQLASLQHARHDVEKQRRQEEILAARDYAFCLYPEDMLRSYFQDLSRFKC